MASSKKVGIVGSGLVGKSWAMIFASKGYKVVLFDINQEIVDKAVAHIGTQLKDLEAENSLRGDLTADQQIALVSGTADLKEAVQGSCYLQECVPEDLDLKLKVWTSIDNLVTDKSMILASSTSCIVPSKISEGLKHRDQFIVAHPVNPPYFVPMVELVPAPWTNEQTRAETRRIQAEVGQKPVSMTRELPGFVLNRLQYRIINEAWDLVASGAVSAEDLDVVMKDGLGMRYAVIGPMEVIHLNAEGTVNYFERYGNTITSISNQMKDVPEAFKMETEEQKAEVQRVHDEICATMCPMDKLGERRQFRDLALRKLAEVKRKF